MTLDTVVNTIEADIEKYLVPLVMAELVTIAPFIETPLVNQIVQWIVQKAVDIMVQKMDLAAYFTYKTIKNLADAGAYEDAIRATTAAAQSGDADAISKAELAQKLAFAKLVGFSS